MMNLTLKRVMQVETELGNFYEEDFCDDVKNGYYLMYDHENKLLLHYRELREVLKRYYDIDTTSDLSAQNVAKYMNFKTVDFNNFAEEVELED